MAYVGNQPVPQATQTRDRFVATSGQTSFATSGYTPNFVDVYLDGVKLDSSEYTATNGSDVVLASGASTGQIMEVISQSGFNASEKLPAQAGNAGEYLTTDGNNLSWGAVDLSTKVSKSGDTMTGDLLVSGAAIGINTTNPNNYVSTGDPLTLKSTANNTTPAIIRMEGATSGAGFSHCEVYAVTGITSNTLISSLTGSGANGFRMQFEVLATGHTGSAANGFSHYRGYWDGSTNNVYMIEWVRSYDGAPSNSDYGKPPVFTFDTTTTGNRLDIYLKSGDGTNNFNGVVEVKYWVPIDFGGSTYTTS